MYGRSGNFSEIRSQQDAAETLDMEAVYYSFSNISNNDLWKGIVNLAGCRLASLLAYHFCKYVYNCSILIREIEYQSYPCKFVRLLLAFHILGPYRLLFTKQFRIQLRHRMCLF